MPLRVSASPMIIALAAVSQPINSLHAGGGVAGCVVPFNDHCSAAEQINSLPGTFDPLPYCTVSADADLAEPQENCDAGDAGVSNSVWYRFQPCGSGTINLNTNGSNYDTVLSVFTGGCANPTQIACDNDSGAGNNSQITGLIVTPNVSYLIKVSDVSLAAGGGTLDFNFTYTATLFPTPAGDECNQAVIIGQSAATYNPLPFCTAGANAAVSEPQEDCEQNNVGVSNSIWYRFTPCRSGSLTINTIGSQYDTVLSIFSGTCGAPVQLACNDDTVGLTSTLTNVPVSAGVTYRIKVADFDLGSDGGLLDFNFSFAGGCAGDLAPVGNGDCAVDASDLAQMLSKWNNCPAPCPEDIAPVGAPDGTVGSADLAQLLSQWGQCP